MKITTRILCLTAFILTACSQGNDFPEIYNTDKAGAFPLLKGEAAASIWTDGDDYPVVGICAEFLADDIERVGQVRPQLTAASCLDEVEGKNVVIAGTAGHSALIDALVSEWRWNVLRGYARRQVDYVSGNAGEHKVRIHFLDPGIVVQELTVR